MKIKKLKLENFRAYKEETVFEFGNLTTFVGKNDIGKSSILEALDIFFNEGKGTIKIDSNDVNKFARDDGNEEIKISVVFDDLPDTITIDATNPTNLKDEFLLNSDGQLEIIKKYPNGGKEKVFIKAKHPTNPACSDLLLKKNTELKKILETNKLDCEDKTKNAVIRKEIWNNFNNLQLNEIEIDVSKEDAKNIWEQLKNYMPLYALFQSDRKNSDGDNEIQDPLKEAVKQILSNENIRIKFNEIANEVENKLKEVSDRTLKKLREMNPEVANSLNPVIPQAENLKWVDVFKGVSISGDENIPINKRGSGIKRLVLLNFFRAEAERRQQEKNVPNIIYGIEEPETSQHPKHQRMLIEAFKSLSNANNTQIILTTHSPAIVKLLEFEQLKLLKKENGIVEVINIEKNKLPYQSLNEVNFLAFGEADEEYHNELYGYIESEGKLNEYKNGKHTLKYKREKNGKIIEEDNIVLSEFIRHQIHHPENTLNNRFNFEQLQESIKLMRDFIKNKIS
ncbi:MAG: ATP/GTP-binding protein [Candidatus Altiarchaeales archaeon HGW-Altiarchaeales-1]|nr:MAG: ATP/GTP-binding protein [Candidatus Altiarchaeales archaeon HGW-Altiarchaeales-1]